MFSARKLEVSFLPVPALGLSWQVEAPSWIDVPSSVALSQAQVTGPVQQVSGMISTVKRYQNYMKYPHGILYLNID